MNPRDTAQILELAAVGADAVQRGLVVASGGNLSVRLSERTFAITATGRWLDRLETSDFVTMDLDGNVVAGEVKPSSEWKLHRQAYAVRPDITAVVHLHPQYAVILSSIGIDIRLITLDHAFYLKSIGVTPFYPNGSDMLADSAGELLKTNNCVVMKHHGSVVVGGTIEMAYRRALNLEEAARATLIARQLGDTATAFPADQFEALHAH